MDGKKVYQIQINGVQESIKAVDTLNNSLQALDKKIKELESKTVNVSTGGGSKSSSTSSLSQDVALEKELNALKNEGTKLEAKQIAYQDESYQKVLAQKDILKEIVEDQKAIAAQERLQADMYSNTMTGMKQKLADLKATIASTDLGDSDSIKKMTKEANELANKLKEMEEAYGQFGRNVGNYQSAAEGFNKFKVTVGGVVREFGSAREAAKQLKMELLSMDAGTKKAQELREAIQKINSDLQDIGKSSVVMDNLLDTMEGFAAVANVGQGIRGLFGVDDAEMQKSIKNLVALQNVLKGIETINKQINTGEGIGGWIKPFTVGIDNATKKLLVYNRALLGTGKAAKVAATGVKVFGKAVKMAISAGILLIVDQLVEKLMDLVEAMKKGSKEVQKLKETQEAMASAYAKGSATITNYLIKIKEFNGSKAQEKKLVEELNSELGNSLGTYDSISKWYDVLTKKGAAYAQMLSAQAEVQAAFNQLVEAQENRMNAKMQGTYDNSNKGFFGKFWSNLTGGVAPKVNYELGIDVRKSEKNLAEAQSKLQKIIEENGLAPSIKKTGKNAQDATKKNEEELQQLRLKLMKEGLNKTLKQMDIEKNALIEKIKANGKNVGDKIKEVNDIYAKLRTAEIQKYIDKVKEELQNGSEDIKKIKFEVGIGDISNKIDELNNQIKNLELASKKDNVLRTRSEFKFDMSKIDISKIDFALYYDQLFNESEFTDKADNFYKFLNQYVEKQDAEVMKKLLGSYDKTQEAYFKAIQNDIEKNYANELKFIREGNALVNENLSSSFNYRIFLQNEYSKEVLEKQIGLYQQLEKEQNERLNLEESNKLEEIKKEKDAANTKLDIRRKELQDVITNFKETSAATASFYQNGYAKYQEYEEKLKALNDEYVNEKSVSKKKELETTINTLEKERDAYLEKNPLIAEYKAYKDAEKAIELIIKEQEESLATYAQKEGQIIDEYANKRKETEINTSLDIKKTREKFYDNSLTDLRDFLSKTNDALNSSEQYFKGWGILNIGATKKNLKDAQSAVTLVLDDIKNKKIQLDKDFKQGLITPEARNTTMSQLNDLEKSFKEFGAEVEVDLEDVGEHLWESINSWLQIVGQAANSILGSLSTIISNQYEAQISEQEKYIEQYEKLLDEQEEITRQHVDAVNSIEDELKTARGDRREQLIDNLNAEMAAQRASLAQEKKIEKEKEKAEEKKKKLEHDQAVAKKKMDLAQAYINAAMAVSMAAVNHWPVPAIPMMALAAAAGAAQIAAVASQNIPSYGTGGVIEGKSHAQGGVKAVVGKTPIELEGDEYVIRKRTTVENLPLLDYINKSERKLKLEDFVDYYGSKSKVARNIQSVKTKFASGGQIPSLRTDIDFNDRLIQSFEDYSNRPVVVAVTEINDKQAAVKNVQVLAGLQE